jgi:CRISPR-associated protein Cas4
MFDADRMMSQSEYQINGTHAHESVDEGKYSSKCKILQGISVYSEEYGIIGKIDVFDIETGILTERKKKISAVFKGQVFQVYAQYFALKEMRYCVKKLRIHSMDDNKNYDLALPEDDDTMAKDFKRTIQMMHAFNPESYV